MPGQAVGRKAAHGTKKRPMYVPVNSHMDGPEQRRVVH